MAFLIEFVLSGLLQAEPWDTVSSLFSGAAGSFPVIVWSAAVGAIGSFAYYVSLRLGFTGGDQRDGLEQKFNALVARRSNGVVLENPIAGVVLFLLIGAGVAATFQAAESVFTPIQSFVLGVTWPMIVSQYTSKATTLQTNDLDKLKKKV